mmetsp:Transcript_21962/g.31543  ORF Transcript_21962/g.31543 Transcript_21962/m.31543 type:complete len:170 (-) Transcript_21962:132-641(-)
MLRTTRHCFNCGKNDARSACSKCTVARYCDRECQRNHWPSHKADCKVLGLSKYPFQSAFVLQNHEIVNAIVFTPNGTQQTFMRTIKPVNDGDPICIYGDLVLQCPFCYAEDDESWEVGRNPGVLAFPSMLSETVLEGRRRLAAQFMTMANNCRSLASFFLKEWLIERRH